VHKGCKTIANSRKLLVTEKGGDTRPPPRPPGCAEPVRPGHRPARVQRRTSAIGVIVVCGQKIALGRIHAGQAVTIAVSKTTLAIELDDQETRVVRRTPTKPVRNIEADRPWTVPIQFPSANVNHHWHGNVQPYLARRQSSTRSVIGVCIVGSGRQQR
jgi:hypothetical protein